MRSRQPKKTNHPGLFLLRSHPPPHSQCTQGYHNRYNPRDMDQCFDCVVSAAQAKSPAEDRCADCIIARGFVGEGNRAFLEKCLKGD
jgi:hypothetical protein